MNDEETQLVTDAGRSGALTRADGDPIPELTRGDMVGRHVVLGKLGAGGMGVVYAGYDPELDRKIALKLVRSTFGRSPQEGRLRTLREAQALAKLNHPNVVSIHDVGMRDDQVWLAMEFVEGQTLDQWQKTPRHWREVLDVYVAAARGLAAAHAVGLLHRDFKPANVMLGDDGRVRVMDFGLALEHMDDVFKTPVSSPDILGSKRVASLFERGLALTEAGAMQGTPRYMAPEQLEQRGITVAADQFAFCVALWEALHGQHPFASDNLMGLVGRVLAGQIVEPSSRRGVPTWLRRICERGLSIEPQQRFASISALIDALERSQARARAKGWATAAVGLAALAAAWQGWRSIDGRQRVAACDENAAAVFDDWNDERKGALRDSLRATGVAHASESTERIIARLQTYAERWHELRRNLCLAAEVRAELNAATYDKAVACLDERRMELVTAVDLLTGADEQIAMHALHMAFGLSGLQHCADPGALVRAPAPPPMSSRQAAGEIRRALILANALYVAGKYSESLQAVRETRALAEEMGHSVLAAEAQFYEGRVLDRLGSREAGQAALVDAYVSAAQTGAWEIAASAASSLVFALGYEERRAAEAKRWNRLAELAVNLAGNDPELESTRLSNFGVVAWAAGEYDEARAAMKAGMALTEATRGREDPERAAQLLNLGNVEYAAGDYDAAQALWEQSLALRERLFGADHPEVADALQNLAAVHFQRRKLAEGIALSRRALVLHEGVYGRDHPLVARTIANIAAMQATSGALEDAKILHEEALDIRMRTLGPEHPDTTSSLASLADLARQAGQLDEAKATFERVLTVRERVLGSHHPEVASTLVQLGELEFELERLTEARAFLDRALEIFDAIEGEQEHELDARFALARVLVAASGERERARALARQARDGWMDAGWSEAAARVDVWLSEHAAG